VRSVRRLRVVAVGGGIVTLATFARADAPIDQYSLFDQTTQSIQDLRTGLYWQRYASTTTFLYKDTFATCSAVTLAPFPTGGWRVPSYKELLTLVDEVPHEEYENGQLVTKYIDSHAFPGTSIGSVYWSSSLSPATPGTAFTVSFHFGLSQTTDVLTNAYVRCVHD